MHLGMDRTQNCMCSGCLSRTRGCVSKCMGATSVDKSDLGMQLNLGKERVIPLSRLRGTRRPLILAGSRGYINKCMRAADRRKTDLERRGICCKLPPSPLLALHSQLVYLGVPCASHFAAFLEPSTERRASPLFSFIVAFSFWPTRVVLKPLCSLFHLTSFISKCCLLILARKWGLKSRWCSCFTLPRKCWICFICLIPA
jgi:hypothetical protein